MSIVGSLQPKHKLATQKLVGSYLNLVIWETLNELPAKVVTQSEVEWWRTLMVECLSVFLLFGPSSDFALMGMKCPGYMNQIQKLQYNGDVFH